MVLIGSIIIVSGLGIVALACIGLYSYATEPRHDKRQEHDIAVRIARYCER